MAEMAKREKMDQFLTAVRTLERERKSRIWCVVHNGRGHICAPTVYSLYAGRDEIGKGAKVEILLHSPGGHPDIAYKAMKFFRRRFTEVNIIVPVVAKSAATLMCLAADKIYMGEFAELGPIDIQIDDQVQHGAKNFSPLNEFKSIEFMREQAIEWMDYYATIMNLQYGISLKEGLRDSVPLVTGLMRPMFEQIEPLGMGEHRRALAISEEYAKRMIALTGNANARQIVKRIVWDYPSHEFCIDFEEATDLGLPVLRLSESQDRLISDAIVNIQREESYHGFAPAIQAPPGPPQVRKKRSTQNSKSSRRVNGRDDGSSQERVRPS
jgi:Serine dehydrogenase proteinase